MRKVTDLDAMLDVMLDAIDKQRPVTVTYLKEAKDEDGRAITELDEHGKKVPVLELTVRTIEPYDFDESKAGAVYFKVMDRETGDRRSFRLDRIQAYTVHRTRFLVLRPTLVTF